MYLQYYSGDFLQVYRPITEVYKYRRWTMTLLHWNIKLTHKLKRSGGRISERDLAYLRLDNRVLWKGRNNKKRKATVNSVPSDTSSSDEDTPLGEYQAHARVTRASKKSKR